MTRTVLVVQHDHLSPLGPVAQRFAEHGYRLEYHKAVAVFPDVTRFDAVVVMGSARSTYDPLAASWVRPETEWLRSADAAGVPVLGICFGGQLLAAAHGGSVAASSAPEIGWTGIDTDNATLVPEGPWFQWHFDRWSLPPGAVETARNAASSQAFVLRRNLAVQFHPELTAPMLAGWLGHGGAAAAERHGLDPADLLTRTDKEQAASAVRAHRLVDGFLRRL